MSITEPRDPVQAGEKAPPFTLPVANRDDTFSLSDYIGVSPVLLCIERGLYCPFCRRALTQLGGTSEKLETLGVSTLAVVSTELERARLYLRLRPTRVPVASDPDRLTHRAYGLPAPPMSPEIKQMMDATLVNPTGELPEPLPLSKIMPVMNERDGFALTPTDKREMETQTPQLMGQFLIDAEGVVRWANIECAGGFDQAGKFPSDDELLEVAKTVVQ